MKTEALSVFMLRLHNKGCLKIENVWAVVAVINILQRQTFENVSTSGQQKEHCFENFRYQISLHRSLSR